MFGYLFTPKRAVFAQSQLDKEAVKQIRKEILDFWVKDKKTPIQLLIDSPGGISSVYGLCNLIRYLQIPVTTICIGRAESIASLLFLCGTERYMLAHTFLTFHLTKNAANESGAPVQPEDAATLVISNEYIHSLALSAPGINPTKFNREVLHKLETEQVIIRAEHAVAYTLALKILH